MQKIAQLLWNRISFLKMRYDFWLISVNIKRRLKRREEEAFEHWKHEHMEE